MTVRFYQSTDASAPTLYGNVNSSNNLVNLLDKILVSGYGSKTAAGWTKPYTGTNKAAFRQASSGLYLVVDDGAAQYSRVRGFGTCANATITDTTNNTNPFPTNAQLSGGGYLHRSFTSDTTTMPWVCIADATFFCLVVDSDGTGSSCSVLMFGYLNSYRTSDAYHCMIACGTGDSYAYYYAADVASSISTATGGHFLARSYTQLGSGITCGKHSDYVKSGLVYPHPVDGGLYLGPLWVHENANSVVRGVVKGVWIPLHYNARPLAHGDTFSGTGALAGKTFVVQYVYSGKSLLLETSDTW